MSGGDLMSPPHPVDAAAERRVADKITTFAGSMAFVHLHAVWFAVWIVVGVGALGAGLAFDPFPFGFLTMIVSLEAIILSTFVMISQNRQAERTEARAGHDHDMLAAVCEKLGLDTPHDFPDTGNRL